jgi:hypothetical protein
MPPVEYVRGWKTAMRFDYSLEGAGWATATLACGDETISMTASYLHDPLRDMASAALALCRGAGEATVVFMDEPGEHQLVLRRLEDDVVQVEVFWHDDWTSWGMKRSEPSLVVCGQTRLAQVRGSVHSVLQRIEREEGHDGYKAKWHHEFPTEESAELGQLTSSGGGKAT